MILIFFHFYTLYKTCILKLKINKNKINKYLQGSILCITSGLTKMEYVDQFELKENVCDLYCNYVAFVICKLF
jgi:hypothetical protein